MAILIVLLYHKLFGEGGDGGLVFGRDGDEGVDAAAGKFTGEIDTGGTSNFFDDVGDAGEFFDVIGDEVIIGVVIRDLIDGLGAHLVAAKGVRFGGNDVSITNIAV